MAHSLWRIFGSWLAINGAAVEVSSRILGELLVKTAARGNSRWEGRMVEAGLIDCIFYDMHRQVRQGPADVFLS